MLADVEDQIAEHGALGGEGDWSTVVSQLGARAQQDGPAAANLGACAAVDQEDDGPGPRAVANARLAGLIGERLAQARAMNGWSQCDFAQEMRQPNSTQLSLWEGGRRLVPLPLLVEAARTLGCSVDYLLGESSEPDRDPKTAARAAMVRRIQRLLEFNAQSVGEVLLAACGSVGPDELRVTRFAARARELCTAVRRFAELNTNLFEDARGGATLLRTCTEMQDSLKQIDRYLAWSAHARTSAMAKARGRTATRHATEH